MTDCETNKDHNTCGSTCKCSCEFDCKCSCSSKFNAKEKFKVALEERHFEIKMFWQRTNSFLLLNTSVGAGAGTAAINGDYGLFAVACIIGSCVCYAWKKISWGAKFWQNHWEQVVNDLQGSVGFERTSRCEDNNSTDETCNAGNNPCGAHDFFSSIEDAPHIEERVRKSLRRRQPDSYDQLFLLYVAIMLIVGYLIFWPILFPVFSSTVSISNESIFISMGLIFILLIILPKHWFVYLSVVLLIFSCVTLPIIPFAGEYVFTLVVLSILLPILLPNHWFALPTKKLLAFLSKKLPALLSKNLLARLSKKLLAFLYKNSLTLLFIIFFLLFTLFYSGDFRFISMGLLISLFFGWLFRWATGSHFIIKSYSENVLDKPSVSRWMHAMADLFLTAWITAFIHSAICIFGSDQFKSEFPVPCLVKEQCSVNLYETPCEIPDGIPDEPSYGPFYQASL